MRAIRREDESLAHAHTRSGPSIDADDLPNTIRSHTGHRQMPVVGTKSKNRFQIGAPGRILKTSRVQINCAPIHDNVRVANACAHGISGARPIRAEGDIVAEPIVPTGLVIYYCYAAGFLRYNES